MVSGFLSGFQAVFRSGLLPTLVAGLTTGAVLLIQQLGGLQSAELWMYDTWVPLRPDRGPDTRMLVVAITEQDLARYGYPLPDAVLVDLLTQLEHHQPRVMGLDLLRPTPVDSSSQAIPYFRTIYGRATPLRLPLSVAILKKRFLHRKDCLQSKWGSMMWWWILGEWCAGTSCF
ncbi:MAG: CHASE2 domain-containing protein [Synechococcaceae cyanobacterium SM2_3_1]|nr:CHASE2 domain-containing protein [Synechococcaceae cyanobacterium SM2_3_1]